ncbi:MAG: heme-binding protein [Verrucomicrobiota bacterium]
MRACVTYLTISIAFLLIATSNCLMANETMFSPTAPNTIEVKKLPAMTAIRHTGDEKSYFEGRGSLFMPLFRYIQKNDIAMTTPVETEIDPGVMMFYVGSDVDTGRLQSSEDVTIHKIPERLVLAVGIRGKYSEENYQSAYTNAQEWLSNQSTYKASGPPRMMYWDGPYKPSFLKKSELHITIEKTQ